MHGRGGLPTGKCPLSRIGDDMPFEARPSCTMRSEFRTSRPFLPCPDWKTTFCPSTSTLSPDRDSAVACTKRSFSPLSGAMKPKPFSELYHLTVPSLSVCAPVSSVDSEGEPGFVLIGCSAHIGFPRLGPRCAPANDKISTPSRGLENRHRRSLRPLAPRRLDILGSCVAPHSELRRAVQQEFGE